MCKIDRRGGGSKNRILDRAPNSQVLTDEPIAMSCHCRQAVSTLNGFKEVFKLSTCTEYSVVRGGVLD